MGWFSMTWPSFLISKKEREKRAFCASDEFSENMWRPFVQSFADFGFNGGPTAAAPLHDTTPDLPPFSVPAPARLVAIGDLHGDLLKTKRALKLAGLMDERGRWAGGKTVAVQVGDILDRGDQEIQIFYLLERLQVEAKAAGGALYVLNGNHETMNVSNNHRYATPGSSQELKRYLDWQQLARSWTDKCTKCSPPRATPPPPSAQGSPPAPMFGSSHWVRTEVMKPGSSIVRRFMAPHPIVMQVGETVFVHGGVLPAHVAHGLERINQETREWLIKGSAYEPPMFLRGATAVVWARDYSDEEESKCDCDTLEAVLRSIPGASRQVVGHTIQGRKGINSACDGKVLRIDVGLSRGCGNGAVQVLEILRPSDVGEGEGRGGVDEVRRLKEGGAPEDILGKKKEEGGGPTAGTGIGAEGDSFSWVRLLGAAQKLIQRA